MEEKVFSIQDCVQPRHTVFDLNDFNDGGDPTSLPTQFDSPSKSVRFNTGGTYKVYFAGRASTPITQTYADGEIEESQIVKITDTDDALVASGAVFIYY